MKASAVLILLCPCFRHRTSEIIKLHLTYGILSKLGIYFKIYSQMAVLQLLSKCRTWDTKTDIKKYLLPTWEKFYICIILSKSQISFSRLVHTYTNWINFLMIFSLLVSTDSNFRTEIFFLKLPTVAYLPNSLTFRA